MTDNPDHETYAVPVFVGIVRCEGTVAEYDTTIASREQHYVALGDYLDAMASVKAAERERDEARAEAVRWRDRTRRLDDDMVGEDSWALPWEETT